MKTKFDDRNRKQHINFGKIISTDNSLIFHVQNDLPPVSTSLNRKKQTSFQMITNIYYEILDPHDCWT